MLSAVLAKQGITEINLSPPEFEEYTVLEDTSVVCSLKTMRVSCLRNTRQQAVQVVCFLDVGTVDVC